MSKLVIYYSLSSVTKTVAEYVAREANADIEAITDIGGRRGVFGFIKSGYEAMAGKPARINAIKSDVGSYDMVIIGTPVWAGRISSPVNSLLAGFGDKIRNYAVFFTRGDKTNDYASLTETFTVKLKKEPLAFLSMSSGMVKAGELGAAKEFTQTLAKI